MRSLYILIEDESVLEEGTWCAWMWVVEVQEYSEMLSHRLFRQSWRLPICSKDISRWRLSPGYPAALEKAHCNWDYRSLHVDRVNLTLCSTLSLFLWSSTFGVRAFLSRSRYWVWFEKRLVTSSIKTSGLCCVTKKMMRPQSSYTEDGGHYD